MTPTSQPRSISDSRTVHDPRTAPDPRSHQEINADATTLMHAVHVALPKDGVWWRQNVGVGVAPGQRVVRFGVPGMGDIGGIYRGQHVEIEVKSGAGSQTPRQKNWQRAVERAGGIYIVARSPEQALAKLAAAMPGPVSDLSADPEPTT